MVLGDGGAQASALLDVQIPCHEADQRLLFQWRAQHDRGREVPDAVDVWFSAEGIVPEWVTTLGAQLSNGTWQSEVVTLAPGRCGSAQLEFRSRLAGTRATQFQCKRSMYTGCQCTSVR